MHERIFGNIGKTLKTIALFCFYLCFCIGLICVLFGVFRFINGLGENMTFKEGWNCSMSKAVLLKGSYAHCYYGRLTTIIGVVIMFCSVFSLPLYAFGELVDSNLEIKRTLIKTKTY